MRNRSIYIFAHILFMDTDPRISFEDTSIAFSYKSDSELRKANFIFSLVNHPWISSAATSLTKTALKIGLPIEGIIKKTVFEHFCGGETINETRKSIERLWSFGVGTILDYSVEGEKSETGFDKTTEELLKTIDNAGKSKAIPFSVFKVTGIGSFELLEKIQRGDTLSAHEERAFERLRQRVDRICFSAHAAGVPVLIDAEETWIQDPIDALAYEMMKRYNGERAIVYNTYQLYRTDAYRKLVGAIEAARGDGYCLGAKLVRGAYMEKERARAASMNYASPIQPDKQACDKAFNEALLFCIDRLDVTSVMCGSHNEFSNAYLTELMRERQLANNDPRVWFAQLYGMSDNISFNLAKRGYLVAKYVPYGPVEAVMPYLFRRAAENTSVAGQSSRELTLIRKELKRRRNSR
ncbi:MAG TPA: proline dehydrogenase family protein [Chryseosolibacter sp.]|nr:proline dehydrogenase family protein [Chryseosolibacter sp.]